MRRRFSLFTYHDLRRMMPGVVQNHHTIMKSPLLTVVLFSLCLGSCASVGKATGFTRKVPASVASQGGWASFKYRVLETPLEWNESFNPLFEPGDLGYPESAERLHRKNIRWITGNFGYGVYEDMQEDAMLAELREVTAATEAGDVIAD
jgi:hypothetical protein